MEKLKAERRRLGRGMLCVDGTIFVRARSLLSVSESETDERRRLFTDISSMSADAIARCDEYEAMTKKVEAARDRFYEICVSIFRRPD